MRTKKQKHKSKEWKSQITQHAKLAKMLLPPTPGGCPPYSRFYYESFRGQLFQACSNSRHRHCPRTSDRKDEHLYCTCPCHRTDLTKHQKRKLFLQLKEQHERSLRKRVPRPQREAKAVDRKTPGVRGIGKTFRYLKAPDTIPTGIMAVVHTAMLSVRQGTVAEVTIQAIAGGLEKITGQDPAAQTSIMLHRLLKAGAVEVVI
jgi:hypothetical protein